MRITHYSFGEITIDGRDYRDDVLVFPDRVSSPWWRRQGHRLAPEDLSEVLAAGPGLLAVGTGASGNLVVPPETARALEGKGWRVRVAPTAQAVQFYNGVDPADAVAALHLTC